MYLTQKNQIRELSKSEFASLRELCRLSKNLYNVGLYTVRQYFFQEHKHLRYESAYHLCKTNENYKGLNTDIAQQTLKVVDRTFKSFYGLISAVKNGSYHQKVKLPNYLPKEGHFLLIIPRIVIKEGKFRVPMSNAFRKQFGEVWIPFPKRLNINQIKEVRIHPKYNARYFEVEFISAVEPEPIEAKSDSAISIDLGVNNLAACVDTNGASFLVDGKPIKSINQWFNKRNAKLQSLKDKQGIKGITNQQVKLTAKRNNQVRDYLNKTARFIVNHCKGNQIAQMVVGYNPGIKQEINIGKCNNQNFVQIPFHSLRSKLKAMCARYGLKYIEQEESYTSIASAIDGDEIPVYNADNPKEYQFSGLRIKRGLYKTKDGHLVNSDLNGSLNIGRKSKHNGFTGVSRGSLTAPRRINLLKLERKTRRNTALACQVASF
ncbi:RNA-guided endonuclease InsQ/TnpB family protein [Aliterella atlantica]|uniref:Transposase n=1 Tax=Aliterella atlantica CENA595 TaxID=1618023 RepID=A0A0D8ZUT2_9CYAN|nr:RNA-guided endonuclease TnpB family protein [Aliterella atlantica]KJH71001.1 transposase [Aliterella atlantica CENA595]